MVTDDPVEAERLSGQGMNVVLVIDPSAGWAARPATGPGRVAVLAGSLADPAVRAAAASMAAELFGPE